MNAYIEAIIIGIIEGLTEFLPVSSTAHIRLSQFWLGQDLEDPYWKMFAIVIQLGAILSVLVYFWTRIIGFLKSFPKGTSGERTVFTHPVSLVFISFVVTAIPCFLMDQLIGENLENLYFIGGALLIGGIVMWVVDAYCSTRSTTDSMEKMTLTQAIVIGAAQILAATFPGTSRSMSTIAAGQVMGLSRSAALEFSFFLSIPVMVAATAFKLLQFVLTSETAISTDQIGALAVGFIVSFVVALAIIAFFMAWVKKRGFVPFAIYRILIGIYVIYQAFTMAMTNP